MEKKTVKTKKPKAEAPAAPAPAGDGILRFEAEELLRLRLARQEAETASYALQLASLQRKALLAQIDPKNLLSAEEKKATDARRALDAAQGSYRSVIEVVCKRLNVDPAKISIDPETGVVSIL